MPANMNVKKSFHANLIYRSRGLDTNYSWNRSQGQGSKERKEESEREIIDAEPQWQMKTGYTSLVPQAKFSQTMHFLLSERASTNFKSINRYQNRKQTVLWDSAVLIPAG